MSAKKRRLVMRRVAVGALWCLALIVSEGCDATGSSKGTPSAASRNSGTAASTSAAAQVPNQSEFPTPVRPAWLTSADLERRAKALDDADEAKRNAFIDDMDFFVFMSAGMATRVKRGDDAIAVSVLLVKHALHRLFYPVSFDKTQHPADDVDFYRTLVTFERRAGLQVDGKFTVSEWQRLNFLASIEDEPEMSAGLKLVYGSENYAKAEGTLVIQDDRISNPVNRAEIMCSRAERRCDLFMAEVALWEGGRSDSKQPQLTTYIEHYDVSEWTKEELRAKTTTACRQIVLTVNWVTDQVHSVATDLTKEGCPVTGRLTKPRLVTLEDGLGPVKQFYESRRELLRGISNSPLERLRSLLTEVQPSATPAKAR